MKRPLAKVLLTDEGVDEVYPGYEFAAKGYGGEEERGQEPEHLKIRQSVPIRTWVREVSQMASSTTAALRNLSLRPTSVVPLFPRRHFQALLCLVLRDGAKAEANLRCGSLSRIQSPLKLLSPYGAPFAPIDMKSASAFARAREFPYPLQRLLRSPSRCLGAAVERLMPAASGNSPRVGICFEGGLCHKGAMTDVVVIDSIILHRGSLHVGHRT